MNSFPEDFQRRIVDILPQGAEGYFKLKPYQAFRINTLKISVEEALAALSALKIDFQKISWCPYAILVPRSVSAGLFDSDFIKKGLLYAQGLESMLAVMVLDPAPGQRVLDLCAAPGSKTTQIAMHMDNTGTLIANEPVRDRFYRLKSVVDLMGAQVKLTSIDGRRMQAKQAAFDRILVDAPCSCEGRFSLENPKSFAFWSVRKIKEMSHKQKGLLLSASRLLAPEGSMVYATCTFAPEENEEVVDWFLRKTANSIKLTPISLPEGMTYPCLTQWQGRAYEAPMEGALRIYPNETMEGFFIAKFINSDYK